MGRRRRALGPELGAEALAERRDDHVTEARGVLLRERPLRRLEGDRERDRLAALAHLLAAVDVKDADLPQLRARRLAGGGDEVARRDVLGDGDGDVLPDRGEADHVLVGDRVARRGEQLVEVELEAAPRALEHARMELAERAGGRPGGLAGVE